MTEVAGGAVGPQRDETRARTPVSANLAVATADTLPAIPGPGRSVGRGPYGRSVSRRIGHYCTTRVRARKVALSRAVHDVAPIVQDVLGEIEAHEPRFVSSLALNRSTGRYEGLTVVGGVLSADAEDGGVPQGGRGGELMGARFEVNLFLNQMGVFNFVDDGSSPGCSVLKLSDGRKRSMSLWVEFITASGYLSARKIRARFHALLLQACDKVEAKISGGAGGSNGRVIRILTKDRWAEASKFNNGGTVSHHNPNSNANSVSYEEGAVAANAEVTICLWDRYAVTIVPAFKCTGMWPRSANGWPSSPTNHTHQYNGGNVGRNFNGSGNVNNGRSYGGPTFHPQNHQQNQVAPLWPGPEAVSQARAEGFTLVSREPLITQVRSGRQLESNGPYPQSKNDTNHQHHHHSNIPSDSPGPPNCSLASTSTGNVSSVPLPTGGNSIEGDTWLMVFTEAEDVLLRRGCRRTCYSVLKTLRDRHLDKLPGNPVTTYLLKTLLLFECDKHPHESEWEWDQDERSQTGMETFDGSDTGGNYDYSTYVGYHYGDGATHGKSDHGTTGNHGVVMVHRITGILIQLISCLQCKKCPHYFLPCVDLLRDQEATALNTAATHVWRLVREIIMDPVKCWSAL